MSHEKRGENKYKDKWHDRSTYLFFDQLKSQTVSRDTVPFRMQR
jgi:hypothetical protein